MAQVPEVFPIDPALLAEFQEQETEQQQQQQVQDNAQYHMMDFEPEVQETESYDVFDAAAQLLAGPPEEPVASSSKLPLVPVPARSTPVIHLSRPVIKTPRQYNKKPRTQSQHDQAVVREDTCSFCQGTDQANKKNEPETMASCVQCGRSGHPSCLNMKSSKLIAKVKSYPWVCLECKTCEVCDSKGDDSRLMFCDGCDRGWHSYCLDPPLANPPKGHWICPVCRKRKPPQDKSHSFDSPRAVSNGRDYSESLTLITAASVPTRKKLGRPRKSESVSMSLIDVETPVKMRKGTPRVRVEIPEHHRHQHHSTPSLSTRESNKKRKGKEREKPPGIVIRLRVPSGGGNRVQEVQEEEEEQVPFGGIIEGADANTSRTEIKEADKEAFERSRKAAEAKLGGPPPAAWDPLASMPSTPTGTPKPSQLPNSSSQPQATPNRSLRDRLLLQQTASTPSLSGIDLGFPFPSPAASHPGAGASEKIKTIRFGPYDIDTWYAAPYPEEYAQVPDGRLWLCEFCLKYMKSGFVAGRHRMKCKARHPPGDEIYRNGKVSVFEVDGRKNKIYCQNLCLLAKMFLDHKTLYYDVEPFLFYVMTEVDDVGARFVGYFSKEKRSPIYNVSCIMTLPVRQRKGWGHLLIDFSYLLSRKEGRVGSPEKPLSALGALSYRNYWTVTVFDYLRTADKGIKIEDISNKTSMTLPDIFSILSERDLIKLLASLAPPSPPPTNHRRNGIARRQTSPRKAPVTEVTIPTADEYSIEWDPQEIEAFMVKFEAKEYLKLVPERLKYTPFLVTRMQPGVVPVLVPVAPVEKTDAAEEAVVEDMSLEQADPEVQADEDADAEGEPDVENDPDAQGESVDDADGVQAILGNGVAHSEDCTPELATPFCGHAEDKGGDEATLRVVAALTSPNRSLRQKRAISGTLDDSPHKRTRLSRAPDTPKKFIRTPTNPYPPRSRRSAGGLTPQKQDHVPEVTPSKTNGIQIAEDEWGDEDAEGEEWIE